MATHSSVLAWRIPGTGEPGGLPSMWSHRVGHDWSDLAAVNLGALSTLHLATCYSPGQFLLMLQDLLNNCLFLGWFFHPPHAPHVFWRIALYAHCILFCLKLFQSVWLLSICLLSDSVFIDTPSHFYLCIRAWLPNKNSSASPASMYPSV